MKPPPLAGARVFIVLLNAPYWGSERHMVTLAAALTRLGADVRVAVCDWEFGGIRKALAACGVPYDEIDVSGKFTRHGSPLYILKMFKRCQTTGAAVKRAMRRFDATHIVVPDETNFLYAVPALLARGQTRSLFVPANVPAAGRRDAGVVYRAFWQRLIARLSDDIVANSAYTAGVIRRLLPHREQIPIVPCALPVRQEHEADPAISAVDSARTNLVYVGQVAAHKGVELLVQAAAEVMRQRADVDLVIAGSMTSGLFRATLNEQVEHQGLTGRIKFIGEVRDVPGLLRKAFVHIAPSLCEESFGLTVIEAKAQGVPSVVFPSGALTETVRHLVDGYCCRDCTVPALVEGLRYFLDSADRRGAAAKSARESVAHYTSAAVQDRWRALFEAGLPPRQTEDADAHLTLSPQP
jgi:glycosyltransferase involved in cell wall biosynthesis